MSTPATGGTDNTHGVCRVPGVPPSPVPGGIITELRTLCPGVLFQTVTVSAPRDDNCPCVWMQTSVRSSGSSRLPRK